MRPLRPGRQRLGTRRGDEKGGQAPDPVDGKIEQVPRRGVRPVRILEAVVCAEAGTALVPEEGIEVVTWQVVPASRRQLPDVGEADRELRGATLAAADALAALDVARWRPEAADLFLGGAAEPPDAPPGTPSRCVDMARRALVAQSVVDLALSDDGGAVSAGEAARRRDALLPLERAARRALVAACSPEVWPPG
jgi:hypothetical protein